MAQTMPASFCKVSHLTPDSAGHHLALRVHAVELVCERALPAPPAATAAAPEAEGASRRGVGGGTVRPAGAAVVAAATPARVAEVTVGDATGCVVMSLRGAQLAGPAACPGAAIVVRNGRVDMFDGYMRLRVDKWGSIAAHPDEALDGGGTQAEAGQHQQPQQQPEGVRDGVPPPPDTVDLANNVSAVAWVWEADV